MAHVVVSGAISGCDGTEAKKKGIASQRSIKEKTLEEHSVHQEARREDARDRAEMERKRAREADVAKKRLRVLATQRCRNEQETVEALEQINKMTPDEALRNLDLYLAKAEAGFADKMAISIRDGVGSVLDRLLRAKGCIAARFQSDQALQSALTNELGYIATFVSNKAVIALSAASDVVGGYQDSLISETVEAKTEAKSEAKAESRPFSLVMSGERAEKNQEDCGGGSLERKRKDKRKKKPCLSIQTQNAIVTPTSPSEACSSAFQMNSTASMTP